MYEMEYCKAVYEYVYLSASGRRLGGTREVSQQTFKMPRNVHQKLQNCSETSTWLKLGGGRLIGVKASGLKCRMPATQVGETPV